MHVCLCEIDGVNATEVNVCSSMCVCVCVCMCAFVFNLSVPVWATTKHYVG